MGRKKILVTGGSGFIGSNLVKKLVTSREYETVVLDNEFRSSKNRLEALDSRVTFIEGDIRNKKDVEIAARGCNVIFHFAFINGTRYFYEKPDLVLEVGVKGAINTLEIALANNIDTYILASSSEVYHHATHFPTKEDERILIPDIKNPRYSYAGGKIISELLTINYLHKSPVKHFIFRPHNVFGPQMGFEHVIPELMKKIYITTNGYKEKKCIIEIQGTGNETRSFCFVDDATDQIMTIFENGINSEIYHIGMDNEKTIIHLIEDISKILDIQIEITPGKLQSGGTYKRCPSIDKVCSLGYSKKDHYIEGLKKTVEWYKEFYKTKGEDR